MAAVRVVEYVDTLGRSPYGRWFERLNAIAAARLATALYRLEAGNFSNVKGVGAGVFETRIDFGPGYRIEQERPTARDLKGGRSVERLQTIEAYGVKSDDIDKRVQGNGHGARAT